MKVVTTGTAAGVLLSLVLPGWSAGADTPPAIAASAGSAAVSNTAVPSLSATAHSAILPRGVVLRPGDGDTRLVLQPGGPYAVMIFRDGALGDRLAIVHLGPMAAARDSAWTLDERFWQEPLWSADANALVWSSDGLALYISTGDHGSGGVFRLDLRNRRTRRLWPNDDASTAEQGPGRSCEMMSADAARRILRVRYQPSATQRPIAVDVWME